VEDVAEGLGGLRANIPRSWWQSLFLYLQADLRTDPTIFLLCPRRAQGKFWRWTTRVTRDRRLRSRQLRAVGWLGLSGDSQNILLSGIGFESAGLASAHSIHNGLTALTETHSFYHGEKVAFGVLAGLQLTDASPGESRTVFSFCEEIGLPTTLADIGLGNAGRAKLMQAAEKACDADQPIHHEAGRITSEKVLDAMLAVDAIGKGRKTRASKSSVLTFGLGLQWGRLAEARRFRRKRPTQLRDSVLIRRRVKRRRTGYRVSWMTPGLKVSVTRYRQRRRWGS
jgi:hypothetical protein